MNEFTILDGVIIASFVAFIAIGWGGGIYFIKKYRVSEWGDETGISGSRQSKIREAVGRNVSFSENTGWLREDRQRVVNAVLQQPPRGYEDVIAGDDWFSIRTGNGIDAFITIYAFTMTEYAPHILMRRTNYQGLALRFFAQLVERQSLLSIEGIVDDDYDIFTTKGNEIDAMTILSPDALLPLDNAPFDATVVMKHDMLYYLIWTPLRIEDTFQKVNKHRCIAQPALEDNLKRWARTPANKKKRVEMLQTPIGLSDQEYFDQPKGKIFTQF